MRNEELMAIAEKNVFNPTWIGEEVAEIEKKNDRHPFWLGKEVLERIGYRVNMRGFGRNRLFVEVADRNDNIVFSGPEFMPHETLVDLARNWAREQGLPPLTVIKEGRVRRTNTEKAEKEKKLKIELAEIVRRNAFETLDSIEAAVRKNHPDDEVDRDLAGRLISTIRDLYRKETDADFFIANEHILTSLPDTNFKSLSHADFRLTRIAALFIDRLGKDAPDVLDAFISRSRTGKELERIYREKLREYAAGYDHDPLRIGTRVLEDIGYTVDVAGKGYNEYFRIEVRDPDGRTVFKQHFGDTDSSVELEAVEKPPAPWKPFAWKRDFREVARESGFDPIKIGARFLEDAGYTIEMNGKGFNTSFSIQVKDESGKVVFRERFGEDAPDIFAEFVSRARNEPKKPNVSGPKL